VTIKVLVRNGQRTVEVPAGKTNLIGGTLGAEASGS
jgi:hypothetical protein